MHGVAALRSVVHFGWRYDYDQRSLVPADRLPPELAAVRSRAAARVGIQPGLLEELLVTHYPAGAGIGWHRDAPMFASPIIGVSLGAACSFRLRRRLGKREFDYWSVDLSPGSMYVLAGPARWQWQHGIGSVPAERFSITLRPLRSTKPAR